MKNKVSKFVLIAHLAFCAGAVCAYFILANHTTQVYKITLADFHSKPVKVIYIFDTPSKAITPYGLLYFEEAFKMEGFNQ